MPEQTMVERVARALCNYGGENTKFEGVAMRESYRDQAEMMVEVMRRPTEAMVDAATIMALSRDASGTWEAMIEATLADEG